MPLGNQYHAKSVEDVLEAVAKTIHSYIHNEHEIPRQSLAGLLQSALDIAEHGRARGPREKEDFQELCGKFLGPGGIGVSGS